MKNTEQMRRLSKNFRRLQNIILCLFYLYKGYLNLRLKRYKKSIRDFSLAERLSVNKKASLVALVGASKMMLEDYIGAILSFDEALELNPTDDAIIIDRALIKKKIKKYDEAIKDFEKAIEINNENPKAYHWLGETHYDKGSWEEAIKYFDKALQIDKYNTRALVFRGDCKQSLNDIEGAKADYSKANEYGSEDGYMLLKSIKE